MITMLLGFGSVKGSPGVTTSALAITVALHGHAGIVLADCDPAGGDVAPRLGLPDAPGAVELAVASRNEDVDELTANRYTQGLATGVRVIAIPAGACQATAAMEELAHLPRHPVAELARMQGIVVIADVGRLGNGSPAGPIAAASDVVAVVVRPELDAVAHLHDAVPRLREITPRLGLVIIGRGRYQPGEVAEAVGVSVLGVLPWDRAGARLLPSAVEGNWAASHTRLVRGAIPVAAQLMGTGDGVIPMRRPRLRNRRRRELETRALSRHDDRRVQP